MSRNGWLDSTEPQPGADDFLFFARQWRRTNRACPRGEEESIRIPKDASQLLLVQLERWRAIISQRSLPNTHVTGLTIPLSSLIG